MLDDFIDQVINCRHRPIDTIAMVRHAEIAGEQVRASVARARPEPDWAAYRAQQEVELQQRDRVAAYYRAMQLVGGSW